MQVQIYFGNNAGVYAGSDEVQQETEEPEAVGSEEGNIDGDTSGDDEPNTSKVLAHSYLHAIMSYKLST